MKKLSRILPLFLVFSFQLHAQSAHENKHEKGSLSSSEGVSLRVQINGNDTIFLASIREVVVYPPMVFKNKKEEKFYWKTVRDVKRTLPYAKLVSSELIATNQYLMTLPDDNARKDYLEEYEKELFKKYEADLRNMTFSQGKMLIKLIDRECDQSSFNLIKIYRGGFSAFFWQGIAKIFGADLKAGYDTSRDEDRIIERVIALVESGQL
ncbi:DUF4294 domain-containing protein [Paludibacter sp. 221]|uniref:DUF4294 domain-containing protein n=1 Tax=Paludibacter sp. 221 TaxID=2302939 RepID=UPI0013D6ECA8|nr:DUF4294 domain-containing protein [Paludibacter sp. 221]NDV46655.1 DUF4294 domain-containing protein [Paludibacter sp. 221]